MTAVNLCFAGRSRYKSSNPLGNDIVSLFCNAGMFEAVMSTASTVTEQASGTVSSVATSQPANTAVVGNFTAVPTAVLANSAAPQSTNVDEKDQSSSHSRDRDRHPDRSHSRERSRRDRSRSRDRNRDHDRSRDRSRDRRRGRDRSRDRGRDRSRSRGRDRERSRSRGRDRDRSHSRGRDRSRGHYRDRSRSRDRDRRRSRDHSRSHDRDRRDDGKRKSRWDTNSSRDQDAKQSSASQMPADGNPRQQSAAVASGMSAASVQNLLTAGRMASGQQPVINPMMSGAVNPSATSVPNVRGRVDANSGTPVIGGHGSGLWTAPGMPNPAGVVGSNDAGKMANENFGQNLPRFPGNASNVATNNIQGDPWKNSGGNFNASDVPNNNTPFSNMVGMPQGVGAPDAGRPYQMSNDNVDRFRGPTSMMRDTSGNAGSNNMNNYMRPQGVTGRFPPPGNMDNVQGFGKWGGTVESDNFSGMERTGTGMSVHANNMQQSSGGRMRMPMSGEGQRGFAPGHGYPGADNMNSMQGQDVRMAFRNSSRMPAPGDRAGVDGPRGMMGGKNPSLQDGMTGPSQRPPYDGAARFGNATRMPGSGSEMQSGGNGSFANMTGMMNNRPESGMSQEMMTSVGQPGGIRPFYDHSASPRPPTQVPPPLMSQPTKQGNTNSPLPPPPPPPPAHENKNPASSVTSQTFAPAPVPAPPLPPSQGSVAGRQTAEQMQAAMAYYYTQWMRQQQQQQQQPPPPPPPPPK